MAGSIGKIYAELDLDASKFTKAQKTILKEAGVVTTGVEKNYKTLGIKSATMFDAMRKQAENAYQGIARSSRATADDIVRAEKAKAQKIAQIDREQFGEQHKLLNNLKQNWKSYGLVAIAAVTSAVYATKKLVDSVAETGDQLHKMSLRTGVTVEELSALGYAAQISGTNIETVEKSLRYASKVMVDYSRGIGLAKRTFEELGLTVVDSTGKMKSTAAFLVEVSDKIKNMTDETKKAAYISEIFGAKAGTQLLPLLKLGSGGITELMGGVKELGNVMSTSEAQIAADYTDAMTNMTEAIEGAKRAIGVELMPKLKEVSEKITDWVSANKELIGQKAHEAVDKIAKSLEAIVSVYNSLPEGVIGAAGTGILVRILTGSTPWGKAAAALYLMNVQLERVGMNIGSIADKSTGLADNLKNIWGVISGELDPNTGLPNGMFAGGSAGELSGVTRNFLDAAAAIADAAEAASSATQESAKKAADKINEIISDNAYKIQAVGKTQYEQELLQIQKSVDEFEKAGALKEDIAKYTASEMELINARQAERDKQAVQKALDESKSAREKWVKEMTALGEKAVAEDERIWEKYDEMYRSLLVGETEFKRQQYMEDLDVYLASEQAKTGATDEEIEKRKALLLEHYDSQLTVVAEKNNEMAEIFKEATRGIYNSFVDMFKDMLDGGASSFKKFCDSIFDMFKSILAQMAALAIARPIMVPIVTGLGSLMGVPAASAGVLQGMGIGGPVVSGGADAGFVAGLGSIVGNIRTGTAGIAEKAVAYGFGNEAGAATGNAILGMSESAFAGWAAGIGTLISGMLSGKGFGKSIAQAGGAGFGAWGGAALGNIIAPGIGTLLGGIGGGLLGGLGVGKLFGGGGEHKFTLSEQVKPSVNDLTFDAAKGFERVGYKDRPGGNEWYGPIKEAYAASIETIQQSFNEMVFEFSSKLPQEMQDQILNELAATDFGAILKGASGGRWKISDAQEAIEGIAQNYADALASTLGNAYANALGDYISAQGAEGLIGDTAAWEVLTARVQQNITDMYDEAAEILKGGDIEGGLEIINTIDAAISQIGQALAPISEIIDTKDMNEYELQLRNINKQFEQYAEALEAAGVDLEKYTDLEEARGVVIAELEKDRIATYSDIEYQIKVMNGLLTEQDQAIYGINAQFSAWKQTLIDLGYTENELAWLTDQWAAALENAGATIVGSTEDIMRAAADLNASLTSSISAMRYGQGYSYGATLEGNLSSIAGMIGLPEEYRQYLIDQAMEYYDLQMASLDAAQETANYSQRTSQTQIDNLRALEKTISTWKNTYDSLAAQVLGYRTSTANPQDVQERLEIARQAIMDVTGGMSAADYIASLGTPEEQTAAVEILRDLYDNYLQLAQEAYQRPSEEYQSIYTETMRELTSIMGYMEEYANDQWQVAIDQLNCLEGIRSEIQILQQITAGAGGGGTSWRPSSPTIPDWLQSNFGAVQQSVIDALNLGPGVYENWMGTGATVETFESQLMKFVTSGGKTFWYDMSSKIFDMFASNPDLAKGWSQIWAGSYAQGTNYVPETGLALVHQGEKIIPRNYDYPEMREGDISISFGDVHIDGSKDPEKTWNAFESKVVKSIRSGKIRAAIQSERRGLN
jgi:hypothetical protein